MRPVGADRRGGAGVLPVSRPCSGRPGQLRVCQHVETYCIWASQRAAAACVHPPVSRSAEGGHSDRPCAGNRRVLVGPSLPDRTANHDGAVFRSSFDWSVLRAARHGLRHARTRVSHGPHVVRSSDGFVCRRACRGRPRLRSVGSPSHERCARRVLAAGGDLGRRRR